MVTVLLTSEQYHYRAFDTMLISSCNVLRQLFHARWEEITGTEWESSKQHGKEFAEGIGKEIFKRAVKHQKFKLKSGNLELWDMTLLAFVLQTFGDTIVYKEENEHVRTLKDLRNHQRHHSDNALSNEEYDNAVTTFRRTLESLKVRNEEIDKIIKEAEATSHDTILYTKKEDITDSTTWDQLSNGLKTVLENKRVDYQGNRIKLCRLSEDHDLQNFVDGKILVQLANGEVPCFVNKQVPPPIQYYIQRRIKSRNKIESKVFQSCNNDKFVIQGLERHELSLQAGKYETDISGNQIKNLTARFILLEHESDFEKICKLATPVHWLKYHNDSLEWVTSSGSVKNLQEFVYESEESFDEKKLHFMERKVTVISDSPGMGKTMLIANIANTIKLHDTVLLRFIVMKEFEQSFMKNKGKKGGINIKSIVSAIAEQSSEFDCGKKYVEQVLTKSESISVLFFDGFDEVLSQEIDTAVKVLQVVSNLKYTKVFVTTRPHMREQLENALGTLGYTIQPFEETDQMNFLLKYFESKKVPVKQHVNQFAKSCLSALPAKITDLERDIAGIPLLLQLLAEICTEDALRCSKVGVEAYQNSDSVLITSVFDMYEKHINTRLGKICVKNNSFLTRFLSGKFYIKSEYQKFKEAHMYYALKLLFPKFEYTFDHLYHLISLNELCGVGIIEVNQSNEIQFVHRTFAEYFVAWFVVDTRVREDWHVEENVTSMVLFSEIFTTTPLDDQIETPFGKSIPLKLYTFKFPVICYFVNSLRKCESPQFVDGLDNSLYTMLSAIFTASAFNNYPYVPMTVPSSQLHLGWGNKDFKIQNIALVAAKYSSVEMMKLYFTSTLNMYKTDVKLSLGSYQVTPLHVAVHEGKYVLVDHLVRQLQNELSLIRYLLHFCVFESMREKQSTLDEKKQIIKLLVKKNVEWVDELLPDNRTPLLQSNVSVDLLLCLIQSDADVNACDDKGNTVLHNISNSHILTPESYHELVLTLGLNGFKHFNKSNYKLRTPLQCAVTNLEITLKTMTLFKCYGANFNAVDVDGNSILFHAIRKGRSVQFLRMLINHGSEYTHVNLENEGVLHISFMHRHYSAIQFFLEEFQLDINVRNSKGKTPFIIAFERGKGLSFSTVKWLEDNGIIINKDVASEALKGLLMNRYIMISDLGSEYTKILDYLVQKGGVLYSKIVQNIWKADTFNKYVPDIIDATEVTSDILQHANRIGILTEHEMNEINKVSSRLVKSERFYKVVSVKEGSFERVCVLLTASNQVSAFLLLRHCMCAAEIKRGGSVLFLTPPPGLVRFILSEDTLVLILVTVNLELTVRRIEETQDENYVNLITESRAVARKFRDDMLNVVVCQVGTSSFINQLLERKRKIICVCNSTEISGANNEHLRVIRDAYNWDDISPEFLKKKKFIVDGSVQKLNDLFTTTKVIHLMSENGLMNDNFEEFTMVHAALGHENNVRNGGHKPVSKDIFNYILKDKLVFKNIELQELQELAAFGQKIGLFGIEVDTEDLDYIILHKPFEFKDICDRLSCNVHLIQYRWDKDTFQLVKTWGSYSNIKPFLNEKRVCKHFPFCYCRALGCDRELIAKFSFKNFNNVRFGMFEGRFRVCNVSPHMLKLSKLDGDFNLYEIMKIYHNLHPKSDSKTQLSLPRYKKRYNNLSKEMLHAKIFTDQVTMVLSNLNSTEIAGLKQAALNTLNSELPNVLDIWNRLSSSLLEYSKGKNSWVFKHKFIRSYFIAKLAVKNQIPHSQTSICVLDSCIEKHDLCISVNFWSNVKYSLDPIKSFVFADNGLFFFIDSRIRKVGETENEVFRNHLQRHITLSNVDHWMHACVNGNLINLMELVISLGFTITCNNLEKLLVLAVMRADIPIMSLITKLYVQRTNSESKVKDINLEFKEDGFKISLLHVAAIRGNYLVMEYLIKNQGFDTTLKETRMRDIMNFCVRNTNTSVISQVEDCEKIIKLLKQTCPSTVDGRDLYNNTPLLVPCIHVDLIEQLIDFNVRRNSTDKLFNNFLHWCPNYMTLQEYDSIIQFLYERGCYSKLFNAKNVFYQTPLHKAVQFLDVLDSTIDIFSRARVDFNAVDAHNNSVMMVATMNQRSARLLNALANAGAR